MVDSQSPEKRGAQRSRAVVHVFVFVGGIALYLLLGLVLWWALNRYIDPQTPTQKRDVVQILLLTMAGVAGAVGLYFTWRGQRITRIGQDITQESTERQLQLTRYSLESTQKDTEQQLRLTEQGQITERFTRAIDQLGATDETTGTRRLEVRLGGIYALERIANDSPDRDYSTIMEVLTAYVRANAARSEPKPTASEPTNQEPPTPSADIQAILTVLGRRKKAGQEGDVVLDLSMTDLRGARLEGAHLERAVLLRADLERARLERAHLEGANLRGANLKGAHLEEAHIEGTDLRPYIWWGADDITFYETAHLPLAEEFEDRLTQKQLEQAHGDEHTRLEGTGLERPAHWGAKTDKQSEGD